MTDTFALFTGMLVGKHKLCPKISPKKTIEGLVGGVVGTLLIGFLYTIIVMKVSEYTIPGIIGLIVLLCGVGIIYANSKAVKGA